MSDTVTLTVTITDLPNADPELVREHLHVVVADAIRAEVDTASVEVSLPLVQVVHVRNPDDGCYVDVYLNDHIVREPDVEDVDPGRGYWRKDWDDRIALANDATNFGRATRRALQDNADSEHIRDSE